MTKRKLSILIVDDNVNFITRMISLINEAGASSIIHSANSYDEATLMLTDKTDLVLLDINLPGRNGLSLLKKIKEQSRNCEVIMVSNHTGDYYRQQCKKLGAWLFLDKTNDFDLIPAIVKKFNA